ncbi:hypothetical protein [Streptomyces sp. NPDC005262]|uniref:hypothetical protein n=1 Tax=Streptomyces sp. NPDC005262 TaxID=3364710 RepID=UPI0036C762E4
MAYDGLYAFRRYRIPVTETEGRSKMMNMQKVDKDMDVDVLARQARFGALPERIRPEDTTEVVPVMARYPSQDLYDHENSLTCKFI